MGWDDAEHLVIILRYAASLCIYKATSPAQFA